MQLQHRSQLVKLQPILVDSFVQIYKIRFITLMKCSDMCDELFYLSDKNPNITLPSRIPNINVNCVTLDNSFLSHTRSHSVIIVSSKILLSNTCDGQSGEHLSKVSSEQLNSAGGARMTMPSWCQAMENFINNIAMVRKK